MVEHPFEGPPSPATPSPTPPVVFRRLPNHCPTQKDWRTVIWVLNNRAQGSSDGDGLKGMAELLDALGTQKRVDWSHGRKGGKPMCPFQQPVLTHDVGTDTSELLPILGMGPHDTSPAQGEVPVPMECNQGRTSIEMHSPITQDTLNNLLDEAIQVMEFRHSDVLRESESLKSKAHSLVKS